MDPLIDVANLQRRLGDSALRVLDVRFSLADAAAGRRAYDAGHVPGAVYLQLEDDLSGPVGDHGGRHPLPDPDALAHTFAQAGIGDDTHVVVVDDGDGMVASRAWWLLRWLGHDAVQVLDGGMAAWQRAGGALETAAPPADPSVFRPRVRRDMVVDRAWLLEHLNDPDVLLVDVRAPERYRGEAEPLDPVAGHIPGAINLPYRDNLVDGSFRSATDLRARHDVVAAAAVPVLYCGSGVSAAQGLLALEAAGVPGARLYPGSWSDWVSYPDAPIARAVASDEGAGGDGDRPA
jgi:thiosulfate/3-mercaptopyruvate sulfurtransferase